MTEQKKKRKKYEKLLSVLLCSCSTFSGFTLAKSKQIIRFLKEKMQFFILWKRKMKPEYN